MGSMELTANHNIRQIVEICSDFEKRSRLVNLLETISKENAKVLIFVATKRVADEMTKYLRQDGWPALAIHGDKEQRERDWVLSEFKAGASPILIATDVASRGLGKCIVYFLSQLTGISLASGIQWQRSLHYCFLRLFIFITDVSSNATVYLSGRMVCTCLVDDRVQNMVSAPRVRLQR